MKVAQEKRANPLVSLNPARQAAHRYHPLDADLVTDVSQGRAEAQMKRTYSCPGLYSLLG